MHNIKEQKIDAGVYEDLIRIRVGIEAAAALIEDFTEAIKELDE